MPISVRWCTVITNWKHFLPINNGLNFKCLLVAQQREVNFSQFLSYSCTFVFSGGSLNPPKQLWAGFKGLQGKAKRKVPLPGWSLGSMLLSSLPDGLDIIFIHHKPEMGRSAFLNNEQNFTYAMPISVTEVTKIWLINFQYNPDYKMFTSLLPYLDQ